jgi:hypothetical protein
MHLYLDISVELCFGCCWLLVIIALIGTPIHWQTILERTLLVVLPSNPTIHHIHTIINHWIAHLSMTFAATLVLLKLVGIPTPTNPHFQALAIFLVWLAPLSYPVTKYLASQEYNRDIPLSTTN